jgi:hydroxymethylpyrimidine pyrophosphatase-like HAD family hydrolase
MQFLLEYFDLPFSSSYAFGDSNNDLEMLQYAAHSVCMEQGSELCRRTAEYVTTGVEQEGIRKALAHYGLFGK